MALRLKKDVQKASYYVWFLGAQEAKELRGERVLLSTIPRLIDRSKHQEPLKVTLQVSHKGLKIIQGSAKHFIPHNAITCSIVSDDIVACVLLLYNPATKCPLHVHAYRCDSDLTAHALHDQLQVLIKKPENQKRFAELELKLEKSLNPIERSKPLSMPIRKDSKNFEAQTRRFDSSLGSDTGTSTRESECSEEQQHSPTDRPSHLYDSLAAELKAKLNGNGPPLLLPPRDYDTISRSQGNLTAVEMRRCQNISIVGKEIVKNGKRKPHHVPSHGSSGIGSDLAPSPERHEEEISTSSSDDWKRDVNDGPSSYVRKIEKIRISPSYGDEKLSPTRYRDNPPSYIFPKEPVTQKFKEKLEKQLERPPYRKMSPDDEPIVVKKQVKEAYIHDSSKKHHHEALKVKGHVEEERKVSGLMRQQSERYRHASELMEHNKYSHEHFDKYERENLTDRQKYREIVESKKFQKHPHEPRIEMHRLNDYKKDSRDYSPEQTRTLQRKSRSSDRFELHEPHGHERVERTKQHKVPDDYIERNPYREPDSLPYRESMESMMKSPVMKYKSRVAYDARRSPSEERYRVDPHSPRKSSGRNFSHEREHYKEASPMSTMKKTSPKDRFQDAKDKFQAMDKIRLQQEVKQSLGVRRSEPSRYEKDYRQSYSPEPRYHAQNEWSSEEDLPPPPVRDFRDIPRHHRDPREHIREHPREHPREREQQKQQQQQQHQRHVAPAKSLGNLAKGYRHSYAEPLKYCGRVGLAAIEPY